MRVTLLYIKRKKSLFWLILLCAVPFYGVGAGLCIVAGVGFLYYFMEINAHATLTQAGISCGDEFIPAKNILGAHYYRIDRTETFSGRDTIRIITIRTAQKDRISHLTVLPAPPRVLNNRNEIPIIDLSTDRVYNEYGTEIPPETAYQILKRWYR